MTALEMQKAGCRVVLVSNTSDPRLGGLSATDAFSSTNASRTGSFNTHSKSNMIGFHCWWRSHTYDDPDRRGCVYWSR